MSVASGTAVQIPIATSLMVAAKACKVGSTPSIPTYMTYTLANQVPAPPALLPSAGYGLDGPTEISITREMGSVVHYETNGSAATCTSQSLNGEKLTLTQSTSLSAVACFPANNVPSVEAIGIYLFGTSCGGWHQECCELPECAAGLFCNAEGICDN
jgi:hypothetical protein